MVRHLDDLKSQRQAEVKRLEAKPTSAILVSQIKAHIALLERQISELEDMIRQHVKRRPQLKQVDLLKSIAGLGDVTAIHLLAELGDLVLLALVVFPTLHKP